MKEKKFLRYLEARRNNKYPFHKNQEHKTENDLHMNPDFPGYPHPPSSKELVKPKTKTEKKVAGVENKDGEKINYNRSEKINHTLTKDGSAEAFDATEKVQE